MTLEIIIVLSILTAAIILFITDKFSPDIVAMLTMLALLLSRTLNITEALAGFANPAVVAIAAIFLITAGLTNTGIAARIGEYLFRIAGKNEARLVAITMTASAMLSLVMNNIAAASVLLPGLRSIARRTEIRSSKLMIPLSFGTLLGGMATLFTTVNLLANDSLRQAGLDPFSLWDFFRIGSIICIAGIAFMATLGRKILPYHPAKETLNAPIKLLNQERDFIVLEEPGRLGEIGRLDKAPWALIGMGLMLLTAGFGILHIATAALLGALVMILSGALKIDEGYQNIEWKAVVMVGGMLSLGTALAKSGAADLISRNLLHVLSPLGHIAVLAGFFLLSMLFAQILSGAATAVLIAPIALSAATQLHASPYPIMMILVLGASSGFLTPVSHPVNVLVMGAGGYKFGDYVRVGLCFTAIVFLIAMVLAPLFWPL